jgi:predicted acyl esterase
MPEERRFDVRVRPPLEVWWEGLSFVPNIFWAKPSDYRKATQRVYHEPTRASFVELPLVTSP